MAATERSYLTGREWMSVLLLVTAVAVVLAAGAGTAGAQSFQEDINETFGSPVDGDSDKIQSVIQTRDGGYALAGQTQSFGSGGQAAWFIKTDSDGNVEVNKTFGGSSFDDAQSVIQTDDGGYALAGETGSFGGGDAWLIKLDANGNEVFSKTYVSNSVRANSVVQTDDGGFALAGSTRPPGGGGINALLVKTDANGNEEFNRTYGAIDPNEFLDREIFLSMVQTSDGGFAFGGSTESFSEGASADAWLVKTNESGDIEINETFGAAGIDLATSVLQTPKDGYALGGSTASFGSGAEDAWLIKTDVNGNEEFNRTYGKSTSGDRDEFDSLVWTQDGGFALAGNTDSFGFGTETNSRDAWLVKTDSNGNEEFNITFGGKEDDEWESLVQTTDGGFAFGGSTESVGIGNADSEAAWLLKISPQEDLFTDQLIGSFDDPPTNTQELDNTLYEDLNGDGDGLGTTQTVRVFGQLIRGNDLNGNASDGSLTDEQARALNWNQGSPETEVTPADMVSLFGQQIRA